MDVLAEVLTALEMRGWLHSRTEAAQGWRFDFAASGDSVFHILGHGRGHLVVDDDDAAVEVRAGDVVVLPHGHAHALTDDLTATARSAVHLDYHPDRGYQVFRSGSGAQDALMLCGAFHFRDPAGHPLLRCLPRLIHIPGQQGRSPEGISDIVGLIARESAARRAGSEVMLRRLTEMLFISVVRAWVEQPAPAGTGWLAALADRPIGTALGLVHQHPEHPWQVQELADGVGLSRSAFSARFTRLVGEPPMTYLTRWRMRRAERLLDEGVPVDRIAHRLGYASAPAFRKAFRRDTGVPPAAYRRRNSGTG
jgi:AraC-like DNA-binding protein